MLAQDEEFQDLIKILDEREIVGVLPDPQKIVTTAIQSTDYLGHCWVHRRIAGGNGDTFLIEWDILGDTKALCFDPSSTCVEQVEIGAPLPLSCGTR